MDGSIGEEVQQVGLYLLYHKAPFVKPLTSQAVDSDTTEVQLPITFESLVLQSGKPAWLT